MPKPIKRRWRGRWPIANHDFQRLIQALGDNKYDVVPIKLRRRRNLLKVESLEATMKVVTFNQDDLIAWGDLNLMARACTRVAKQHGFVQRMKKARVAKFPERIALIHSELSEALEEYRNGHGLNEVYQDEKGKLEGVPIELADALIRILDLCGGHDIDIADAVRKKHEYNKTRPFKHGGKRC